jgi:hypothetical protein
LPSMETDGRPWVSLDKISDGTRGPASRTFGCGPSTDADGGDFLIVPG